MNFHYLKVASRVAKSWGLWDRVSHEIKICRAKRDPGPQKSYSRKIFLALIKLGQPRLQRISKNWLNTSLGTNIQNPQNKNIKRDTQRQEALFGGKNYVVNFDGVINIIYRKLFQCLINFRWGKFHFIIAHYCIVIVLKIEKNILLKHLAC